MRRIGYGLSVPQLFANPTIRGIAGVARNLKYSGPEVLGTSSDRLSTSFTKLEHDPLIDHSQPFPLIGINKAHFVGLHTSSYSSSGVAPQIYFEWLVGHDPNHPGQVDIRWLEQCIDEFVSRHPVFRSYILPNGSMKTLEYDPHYEIQNINEWTTEDNFTTKSAQFRHEMISHGPDVYQWPLFEFRVSHAGPVSSLIHVTVSLFLMDALGDLVFRHEMSMLYRSQTLPPPPQLLFCEYSRAIENELPNSEEYRRAREFWYSRIDSWYSIKSSWCSIFAF